MDFFFFYTSLQVHNYHHHECKKTTSPQEQQLVCYNTNTATADHNKPVDKTYFNTRKQYDDYLIITI